LGIAKAVPPPWQGAAHEACGAGKGKDGLRAALHRRRPEARPLDRVGVGKLEGLELPAGDGGELGGFQALGEAGVEDAVLDGGGLDDVAVGGGQILGAQNRFGGWDRVCRHGIQRPPAPGLVLVERHEADGRAGAGLQGALGRAQPSARQSVRRGLRPARSMRAMMSGGTGSCAVL
jgi:hypothetical protein